MGRGCLPGSCLSLLVFDLCRPLKEVDLGGGIFIEIFDSIYGVSLETEVIHYPKHAIVVSGIES